MGEVVEGSHGVVVLNYLYDLVGANGNSRNRVKVCQHLRAFGYKNQMKKSGTAEDVFTSYTFVSLL
jgi:hypothetical protein